MERNNYKPTSHSVTSTNAQILPVNGKREALILFNTGANAATFSIGGVGAITLGAGEHVAFLQRTPINSIWAASASGTTIVSWEA